MLHLNQHIITDPQLLQARFWIDRSAGPDQIIMQPNQIARYNQAVLAKFPGTVFKLTDYPAAIDRNTLTTCLTEQQFPDQPLYLGSQPVTPAYYANLEANLNLTALPEQNPVRYGFTLKRANLRTFPTADLILEDPGQPDFDRFQETALNPAEPVIVLHQSSDRNWYYIQAENYRGWVAAGVIGIAAQAQWQQYLKRDSFLIVTGSHLRLTSPDAAAGPDEWHFEMGAQLPLAQETETNEPGWVVELPVIDTAHQLGFKKVLVPPTAAVRTGFLPYTRAGILNQAFKLHGQRYDWGGLNGSVDCSGFIMAIYRCFGLRLPRNSGEQARLPGPSLSFASPNPTTRTNQLRQLPAGALLHLKGHVMLYLGEYQDCLYMIHALSSYGSADPAGNLQKIYHLQVSVTDLLLLRANGQTFLEALSTATQVELN